jgi:hypothetical protein
MMDSPDVQAYEPFLAAKQYSTPSSEGFAIDECDLIGPDPATQGEIYVTAVDQARPRERLYLVKPIVGSGAEWTVSLFFAQSAQSGNTVSDGLERAKRDKEIRRRIKEAIEELRELSDGWAGEGSVAPSNQAIEDAERFVSLLPECPPVPTVCAADDGEILMDWALPDKRAVVGLEGDGGFGYALYIDGGYKPGSEEGDLSVNDIPSDLKSYLQTMKAV